MTLKQISSLARNANLARASTSFGVKRHYPGLARHFDWGGEWRKQLDSHEHLILTPEEARMKALAIYRKTLKILPLLRRNYGVPLSLEEMKEAVRRDFERNKNVHHIAGKEALLRRAHILLFEASSLQLMSAHVINYFCYDEADNSGISSDQKRVIDEYVKKKRPSLYARSREAPRPRLDDHQIIQYVGSKFDELDLTYMSRDHEKAYKDIVHRLDMMLPEFHVYDLLEKGLKEEIDYKIERFMKRA